MGDTSRQTIPDAFEDTVISDGAFLSDSDGGVIGLKSGAVANLDLISEDDFPDDGCVVSELNVLEEGGYFSVERHDLPVPGQWLKVSDVVGEGGSEGVKFLGGDKEERGYLGLFL